MKKLLNVVSMDPSLRNWGVSHLTLSSDLDILVQSVDLFQSEETKSKTIKQNSSDITAANYIYACTRKYVEAVRPNVIVIEVPIGSQSARAMASYGVCIGLIGSIKSWGIPIIEVSPFDVKKVIGKRETTKQEIVDWVLTSNPETPFPLYRGQINMSKAEHIADSIVATYASLNKPQMKELIHAYYN